MPMNPQEAITMPESDSDNRITTLLHEGIEDDVFRGAAAAVGSAAGTDRIVTAGTADDAGEREVTRDTVFDVASLTKPVATTTVALRLAETGELELSASLGQYVPPLSGTPRGEIPIRSLLTHTSGLPPYKAFPFGWESREALLESLYDSHLSLLAPPDELFVYSDLNFVHLADACSRLTNASLPELVSRHVLEPAGMKRSALGRPPADAVVAETRDWRWRERVLHGEVHDYIAAVMDGESGNAGLFATAPDLARFARMLLNGGHAGDKRVLARETVARLRRNVVPGVEPPHGLGWRLAHDGTPGLGWSPTSFGHTGFTGTSLWLDPQHDQFAVLLTNRLLVGEDAEPIARFRERFHTVVAADSEEVA